MSKASSSSMKRSGSDTSANVTVSLMDPGMRLQSYVGLSVTIALATYLCIIMPLQHPSRSLTDVEVVLFVMWLFFVDVCIFAFIGIHRMKIVTSPWGIEYYGLVRTVRAHWSDVMRVDRVRSGYQDIDALILRRQPEMSPVMRGVTAAGGILRPLRWIIAVAGGNWGLLWQDVDADKLQQAVPLGYLASDWQSTELGSEIERYAPQVLGGSPKDSAPAEGRELVEGGSEEAAPPLKPGARARTASASSMVPLWTVIAIAQLAFTIFVVAPWYGCADEGCLATRTVSAKVVLDSVGGPYVLSRDGKTLADNLRLLKFPETNPLRNFPRFPGESEYDSPTTALSRDGKTFAAGYFHGWAQLWSVEDGSLLYSLPVSRSVESYIVVGVAGLDFSPDGNTLASVDTTGEVRLWSVADGTLLQTLALDEDTRTSISSVGYYQVAFAPGARQIAGNLSGTVYVWNVAGGSRAYTLPDVGGFAFSPDGKWLATGSNEEPSVTLWNAADGSLHERLNKHKVAYNTGVAISPDSKTLAYMLDTGELGLWDLVQDREKEVVKLVDTPGKYNNLLTFTPDGNTLLFSCDYKLCAVDLSQP